MITLFLSGVVVGIIAFAVWASWRIWLDYLNKD